MIIKKFKNLKLKEILPFYISDINDKFFVSLNNHPNKSFVQKILPAIKKNLKEEELKEFNELDNLTKAEKIRLMLNLSLRKIVSKTGSYKKDIFALLKNSNLSNPLYIDYMDDYNQRGVGSIQIDRRYNFYININPDSYLHNYLSQIQLSFYLDEDNKILSGGFSLNYENDFKEISFEKTVNKIYLRRLVKNFILKQLYPISLNNILDLIEDYKPKTNNKNLLKNKKNKLEFKFANINDIKENWVDLINKKYLKYQNISDSEKKYYENDFFFSIMTVLIIILSLYEELRIYFTHDSPELILGLLNKPQNIKEDPNQNAETDFYELSKFLQTNYFSKKEKINLNKVKSTQELIEIIADVNAKNDYESFGFPIPIYEINDQLNNSLITPESIFKGNDYLKIIYLLTISPELFGIDEDSSHFIGYGQLIRVIKSNAFNDQSNPLFYEKIKETNCELNYNFVTFLTKEATLILMNEQVDVYHDYFWAQIYTESIDWIYKDIQFDFNNDPNPKVNSHFYQDKIQTLENLIFNWYDDFYGIPQIKNIVYKIDNVSNLKSSLRILIDQISEKDHIFKKDTERSILVFAFIVASLIGFNNFIGMIFTVLSVNGSGNINPINITFISISTILVFLLIIIMGIFFYKSSWKNRKIKKNSMW